MFSTSRSLSQPVRPRLLVSLLVACGSLFAFALQGKDESASSRQKPVLFKDVESILQKSCVACHGENLTQGKLRLDSEVAVLRGGVSGPAIIPGKSGASLL